MITAEREASVPEEVWRSLGAFLARQLLLLSEGERASSLRRWTEIRDLERALDDRLLVGLVGGTGVGKSTLINALAGEQISRSGDRRPTTDRVVAYRHRKTPLPAALPAGDISEPEVVHENEALERVIVLDFPDFDSVEELHQDILERQLPHLDVLLLVVDDVKYGDSRLFFLLRELPQSHANLHGVLNKIDILERRYPERSRAVCEEILADFSAKLGTHAGIVMPRERLHPVSALGAFLRRAAPRGNTPSGGPADLGAGDFDALVRFLESYRLEKRRRAAKELNIESRKADFVEDLRARALDPAKDGRIVRLAERVERRRLELRRAFAGTAPGILRPEERRRIISASMGRTSTRFGFPLDFIIALGREVGRLRGRRTAGAADLSAKRVIEHYRPYLDGVENLIHEAEVEADGILTLGGSDPRVTVDAIQAASLDDMGAELRRGIAAREDLLAKRSRFWNHALPLLVAGLYLWSFAYPVVRSAAERLLGESDSSWGSILKDLFFSLLSGLDPSFIVGFLVSILLAYAITALASWVRQVERLDRAITEAEERVRERVREHGERAAGEVAARLARWRAEREELARIVGPGLL